MINKGDVFVIGFDDTDEKIVLKDGVIDMTFCLGGMEVAKISNEYLGDKDSLAFGRIAFEGYDYVLLPLTEEEFQRAEEKYYYLLELFS